MKMTKFYRLELCVLLRLNFKAVGGLTGCSLIFSYHKP